MPQSHSIRAVSSLVAIVITIAAPTARAEEPTAPPSPPPAVAQPAPSMHHPADHVSLVGDARYRSPGMAAALSLTPVPVDFGNFYAENVGWGIAYTSGQLALGGAMMWIGAGHMCHGGSGNGCSSWSDTERNSMVGLVAGYVALKVVAAVHASEAAEDFNRVHASPVVTPTNGGVMFGWTASF